MDPHYFTGWMPTSSAKDILDRWTREWRARMTRGMIEESLDQLLLLCQWLTSRVRLPSVADMLHRSLDPEQHH